jgi:hypothetical protein
LPFVTPLLLTPVWQIEKFFEWGMMFIQAYLVKSMCCWRDQEDETLKVVLRRRRVTLQKELPSRAAVCMDEVA